MTLLEAQQAQIAPWDTLLQEYLYTMIYLDRYPCTPGHRLYVPKTDDPEYVSRAFSDALTDGNQMVINGECDAFNIGLNMGQAAGQTVMYPHIHLIPRRWGDVADPVGGVRNTIPGKGNYRK